MDMQAKRKKNFFIKTSGLLNHEPLLLVQRPKSEPITETTTSKLDDQVMGFMKPRLSKIVRPSSHKTIDIYTVQPTKKKNLWENFEEDKSPRFTSVIRPCAKLSQIEVENLKNEYTATKPSLSFDKVSKAYVLSRSDLAPSSAKRKRLSGQMSPESEQEVPSKGELDVADDDDDDNDDLGLYNDVAGFEKETKHAESEFVPALDGLPTSSSFITDIEAFDRITNESLQQNGLNEDKQDITEIPTHPNSGISETEQVYDANIVKDTSGTDTKSNHDSPQNSIKPSNSVQTIDVEQEAISVRKQNSEHIKQYSEISEHKRIEQTITLKTKGNLSKFNVTKAGILGRVLKTEPSKQPKRKQKTSSNTAAVNTNVRKDGYIRKASAKSVKFSEL